MRVPSCDMLDDFKDALHDFLVEDFSNVDELVSTSTIEFIYKGKSYVVVLSIESV